MPGKSIRNPMSQTEIVREIAAENEMTQGDVKAVLDSYKNVAQRHIQKGSVGEFKILGLVKLERTKRKARKARNPRTGETIKVPAKRAVKAKPMSAVKNLEL